MTTNETPWTVDEIDGERARGMLQLVLTELGITPDWRGEQAELQVQSALRQLQERAEQAGNPDIRDLAYRSMRQQRDQAVDRAEKAEADLLTERMTELKLVSDLRERVEKTQAERDQLIGFACDGSSTCPSPLHVDGCFRSEPQLVKERAEKSGQDEQRAIADRAIGEALDNLGVHIEIGEDFLKIVKPATDPAQER